MKCIFEATLNSRIKKCKVCGFQIETDFPINQIHSECAVHDINVKPLNIEMYVQKPDDIQINQNIVERETKAEVSPEMPSIWQQGYNFLGAIKDFIAHPEFVSKEEYEERIKICNQCPARIENRCSDCGCFLATKAKGAAFHCPRKKWPGDK